MDNRIPYQKLLLTGFFSSHELGGWNARSALPLPALFDVSFWRAFDGGGEREDRPENSDGFLELSPE